MGGHGGLNILPQKRWNVYNRDNRAQVARDELAAKLDEEEERERQLQAAQAERLAVLRKRRLGIAGDAESGANEHQADSTAAEAEQSRESGGAGRPEEACGPQASDAKVAEENEAPGRHVNLFEAEEAMNKARAIKERGKNDSRKVKLILGRDATDEELRRAEKFEEGFRFGGDLKRKTQRPWYTLPNGMEAAAEDRVDTESFVEKGHPSEETGERKSKKRKKEKKEKRKGSKSRRSESEEKRQKLEEMRKLRLQREAQEKRREKNVLKQAGLLADQEPKKEYYSAFGYSNRKRYR